MLAFPVVEHPDILKAHSPPPPVFRSVMPAYVLKLLINLLRRIVKYPFAIYRAGYARTQRLAPCLAGDNTFDLAEKMRLFLEAGDISQGERIVPQSPICLRKKRESF